MNIALITEGGTDQIVLKPIVEALLPQEEIYFRSLQPAMDNTDRQKDYGGWKLVMKALERLDVADLLEANDMVIVHIDSDVSYQKGFDVPHAASGQKVDTQALYEAVVARLLAELPASTTAAQKSKFVFAIGLHSIECWLVGLVDASHGQKVLGHCLKKLNDGLVKQKFCGSIHSLKAAKSPCKIIEETKNKGASRQIYFALAAQLSKPKVVLRQAKLNVGFAAFVGQIGRF
jgi:hypothetical protein